MAIDVNPDTVIDPTVLYFLSKKRPKTIDEAHKVFKSEGINMNKYTEQFLSDIVD